MLVSSKFWPLLAPVFLDSHAKSGAARPPPPAHRSFAVLPGEMINIKRKSGKIPVWGKAKVLMRLI
jgi:hypothetical protein